MSKQQLDSDYSDVSRLKKGNNEAYAFLYSKYAGRLFHFAFGYLKSRENAEELIQEVFFIIWKNRKSLRPELSFKAYIFKIAYNLIIEMHKINYRNSYYKEELLEEVIDERIDIDEQLNYQLILSEVEMVVDKLPKRQKEILIMKRKEGYSVKEIAEFFKISPKTVENHITEAIRF